MASIVPVSGRKPRATFNSLCYTVGHHRIRGQAAVVVQQQMQLDRALPLPVLDPIEHDCRQLDDAAVQAHHLVLETEHALATTARRRLHLTLFQ